LSAATRRGRQLRRPIPCRHRLWAEPAVAAGLRAEIVQRQLAALTTLARPLVDARIAPSLSERPASPRSPSCAPSPGTLARGADTRLLYSSHVALCLLNVTNASMESRDGKLRQSLIQIRTRGSELGQRPSASGTFQETRTNRHRTICPILFLEHAQQNQCLCHLRREQAGNQSGNRGGQIVPSTASQRHPPARTSAEETSIHWALKPFGAQPSPADLSPGRPVAASLKPSRAMLSPHLLTISLFLIGLGVVIRIFF
jgi:hypothetical protein